MRSAAEYKEILARFKKEFGAQFGIKELGIFGSVAREVNTGEIVTRHVCVIVRKSSLLLSSI